MESMKLQEYDLLVIGGGITGAGIALDASLRGIKTGLVEMSDFGSGTSGKSTKLIHGGLRYLQQGRLKEVASLGRERDVVYRQAPHVTEPIPMLLPFKIGGAFSKKKVSLGLKIYDILAGVRKSERRNILSTEELLEMEPLLRQEGLLGGGEYVEYRTDDARLTIEVVKSAADEGADIINYVKSISFTYDSAGKICGIVGMDMFSGEEMLIKGKVVINAGGPWVDDIRTQEYGNKAFVPGIQLSKGIHIVLDTRAFPLRSAVYFDAPDGRLIFAIPRNGKTYVGTTDTFYEGALSRLQPMIQERDYLLQCIHAGFPDLKIGSEDVETGWAGVRPLILENGKKAGDISRKDEIWQSQGGLFTIAGGKLTGYRKMAQKAVDKVSRELRAMGVHVDQYCATKQYILSGGQRVNKDALLEAAGNTGLSVDDTHYLFNKYGSNTHTLLSISQQRTKSFPGCLYAMVHYAVHYEMAMTPTDFFARRTGDLYFNFKRVLAEKDLVFDIMAELLGWQCEEASRHRRDLDQALHKASFGRYKPS